MIARGRSRMIRNPIVYGFAGMIYDEESNLYKSKGARVYDPTIGRYLQSDPLGLRGGINTYDYGRNNPLRFTDPFGLAPGDNYSSEAAAAQAALTDLGSPLYNNGTEYVGFVYSTGSGYTYTAPNGQGDPKTVTAGSIPSSATASYHNHPNGAPLYYAEDFSNQDLTTSQNLALNAYVSTPGGQTLVYNVITGKTAAVVGYGPNSSCSAAAAGFSGANSPTAIP